MAPMPTLFVPHGGGPWPWMESMGPAGMMDGLRQFFVRLLHNLPRRPTAILVVSAHWECPVPTVMAAKKPPMLYDYSGFPPHTYRIQWPAPGAPELAERIEELLATARLASSSDGARGFDHGTYVVTKLMNPEADIPTLQLSLVDGLDPLTHFDIGRALASLRQQGVLILGSGMSYHNMQGFRRMGFGRAASRKSRDRAAAEAFDDWLVAAMVDSEQTLRQRQLVEWAKAPGARDSHPREEHLLPLMVVAGAAYDDDRVSTPFRAPIYGLPVSAVRFG